MFIQEHKAYFRTRFIEKTLPTGGGGVNFRLHVPTILPPSQEPPLVAV